MESVATHTVHCQRKHIETEISQLYFKINISLSIDNYLAMEVACTMVCPKANQEVIITQPDGKETQTQKCEKCEGECPKGLCVCVFEFVCAHML